MKPTFSDIAGMFVAVLIAEQKNELPRAAAVTGAVS